MDLIFNTLMGVLGVALFVVAMPGIAAWNLIVSGSGPNILFGIILMVSVYGGVSLVVIRVVHDYVGF